MPIEDLQSANSMTWSYEDLDLENEKKLSSELEISPILARLLSLRHISPAEANEYLYPQLKNLADPFLIENLESAAHRIIQAFEQKERILVMGDYDVDGITSTTLIVHILRLFGADPKYIVPRRLDEGYGLSKKAIERGLSLNEKQPNLFIALDCGTNSIEEVEYLESKNIDVIIIDHHQKTHSSESNAILVNPHVNNQDPVSKDFQILSTAGLAFKMIHGLVKVLRKANNKTALDLKVRDFLDFSALGTLADMVPLKGENRIITKYGLEGLQDTKQVGLRALLSVSGIPSSKDINGTDIAFKICPRINASGRLADASLPLDMFLSESLSDCHTYAKEVDQINLERKKIEQIIAKKAIEMVDEHYANDSAIVVYHEDWHPGVVGIVASRLCRTYSKPSIVLGADGSIAQGSGRTIKGVDMVEVLKRCEVHLEKWGGHPLAVGLSLESKNVNAFRDALITSIEEIYPNGFPPVTLDIDAWINLDDLGEDLLYEMDLLRPFGQENKEPVFAIKNLQLPFRPKVFSETNFRFQVYTNSGTCFQAIAWRMAEIMPPHKTPIDIAFKFAWNEWNGRKDPQITLVDWRHS